LYTGGRLKLECFGAIFYNLETFQAFEFEFESYIPLAGNDPNYLDYGTMRVAKKGRNSFVMLGDFPLRTNFGNEIIVSVLRSYFEVTSGSNCL
jgi:hypothetical protein